MSLTYVNGLRGNCSPPEQPLVSLLRGLIFWVYDTVNCGMLIFFLRPEGAEVAR